MDFYFSILDNGDNRVYTQCHLDRKRVINICCNLYEPIFDPCNVMLAGSGSGTYIKRIRIASESALDSKYRARYPDLGRQWDAKRPERQCCSLF